MIIIFFSILVSAAFIFVFFQYLGELVSKEMRVSDKAVSVSTLEL